MENADELINEGDFNEIKIINNRATAILDRINTLVANIQELKIDRGETARNVRQWQKETKEIHSPLAANIGKLSEAYNKKQRQIDDEIERNKQVELQERERQMWEEKFNAELKMTEKKIEMETRAKVSIIEIINNTRAGIVIFRSKKGNALLGANSSPGCRAKH